MSTSLIPGQKVPLLKVGLHGGDSFDLASEDPENFSVVFFYRGHHCPICKKQLEELSTKLDAFDALGAKVVAVSMDSLERAKKTAESWEIGDLRLGYNLTASNARQWGLFISEAAKDPEPPFFTEPAVFVVKPDGTLYAQYLQNVPFARPRSDDLLGGLKFIIENDYPIRGTVAVPDRAAD